MQSSADERREYYRGQRGRRTASQDDNRSYELNDLHTTAHNQSSDVDSNAYNYHESQQHSHYQPQDLPYEQQNGVGDVDDEEDYSISVSAIMQRRASVRGYRGKRGSRSSRRASSPMDHVLDSVERRRSSVYTTSSEEGTNQESTQEQIFENIRLHKEVIQSVKLQPWPIRKKLKLVRQAKTYVARHEGALQERFAMSRSTRDLWARFKILMAARWRHWKRETTSLLTVLIPWELRIKEIESHFGSGVASYFTFLRWLMWVNIMIAIPLVAFVIGPEYFATKHDETDPRKRMSEPEYKVAGNLFTFWEFEGYLKYSPMFYGYYSSTSGISTSGYKLPLAYFLTAVLVYIYSFVATLRKMAENSRNSKLSSKDDECVFSWKLFTGWDFMIGHAETAHNRIASVVVGFKEALLEEAEKKKDNRNWRVILQRILVNILVMGLLGLSGATVVLLVNHSEDLAKHDNWLSRNAVNVTMTLLSFFLPMIFEALGLFENWHPRQQLRLQLARIMILNMLNLYSLMFSFIYKINSKEKPLQMLKLENETNTQELHHLMSSIETLRAMTTTTPLYSDSTSDGFSDDLTTTTPWGADSSGTTDALFSSTAVGAMLSTVQRIKCYNITFKCSKPRLFRIFGNPKNITTTLMLLNLTTTTMLPSITTPTTTTEMWTSPPPITTTETTTTTTTTPWTTLPTTTPTTTTTKATTTTLPTTQSTTTTTTTTTTAAPFTTDEDGSYDYGSDEPQLGSSSTTTTPAPGNDSYFNYVDYFEGGELPDGADELVTTEQSDDPLAQALAQLDEQPRKKRQVEQSPPVWHTSRYSRRHRNGSTTLSEPTTPASYTPPPIYRPPYRPAPPVWTPPTSSSSTTTTTTTTRPLSRLSEEEWRRFLQERRNKFNIPNITTTTTTSTTPKPNTATRPTTTTTIRTTEAPTTSTTENIESSSSTTESFSSSSSSDGIFGSSSTTEDDENIVGGSTTTTPFYIDYAQIEGIGSTVFYDNDAQHGNTEHCVITVCPPENQDFFGSTTTADGLETTLSSEARQTTVKKTPLELQVERLKEVRKALKTIQMNLTTMCWETSLGQELSKVIVFDGLMSIVAPLCIDFLRALFVRYVNQNWCWDMEKTFPQYGDFKIAENILTLINNQGQVWMGIFFSPGLVLINLVKLMIMMYFRSWIVLTCNVPHEVVFKASKSNNFYLSLLLTMLFLCVLPVGYAIVWLRPSWHCGPFSEYNRIAEFITNTTRNALPKQLHEPLDYLTSSSTVIPLLLLLILIIYYLISLTGALREANQDLRTQLQKEREEERKKIFKVPEVKQAEPTATTLTNRWRKVLEASSPVTPTQPPDFDNEEYKNQARKELISRIMKKALRKGSATSDDDSLRRDDDDTDTEHQDSLPHDEEPKEKRSFGLSRLQQIRRTRKPSLVDIVQIAKQERARSDSIAAAANAGGSSPGTNHFPVKEPHPKSRFKVDRHERKERESFREKKEHKHRQQPPPYDPPNEHDPETNSRIVNERRASLLRRKRDKEKDKEKEKEKEKDEQSKPTTPEAEAQAPEPAAPESHFHIVDEKKPPEHEEQQERPPPPPVKEGGPLEGLGLSKFKFRRHKSKHNSSTSRQEPEVFKFDDKSLEKNKSGEIPQVPSSEHLNCELTSSNSNGNGNGSSGEPQPLPSPTPSLGLSQRQMNAEKLAALSRQGRKKIGSLLALVREAVNLKKDDVEQGSDESPGPTTPTYLAYTPPPPPSVLSSNSSATALDMPPTPEPDSPTPSAPLHFGSSTSSSSSRPTIKPPIPPAVGGPNSSSTPTLATMDDLEELDLPGPITFPKRSASQRRRVMREDSQSSIWSDNIPTITISTTGSDECIVEPEVTPSAPAMNGHPERSDSPGPTVNIIKIDIEESEDEEK
ncbi:transmembrane channel-like protein isoform X2 [Drosophila albomicans]|uniref:Transmembrane channel-like protein isoform X2 n=1 Tax=Drosophila albomicans TaxID=7291 RepID=A0A6P8X1N5_DROAB|nr:transmembrane channel-like protein isoform X2 [Drosophila albomicans]